MESVVKLILVILPMWLSETRGDSNDVNDEDQILSSAQFERTFEDEEKFKKYIISKKRIDHITGFICACALIREANHVKHKEARAAAPDYDCADTWEKYFQTCDKPWCQKLRGSEAVPALLLASEYCYCARSLCHAFDMCTKHIQCDRDTVQVLNQLRAGTSKTITDMLQEEKGLYLLTVEKMKFLNIFMKAIGAEPFPFFKFRVGHRHTYAIPRVRNITDRMICPRYFRFPDTGTKLKSKNKFSSLKNVTG